jgi:glycerol transport system ATP-binding protein
MLQLEQVSLVRDGQVWIHPTTLSLARGGVTVLLGATGAGKTTLMRMMAGLDTPTTGLVKMDGRDVTRVAVRRRNVAMVYQQFINYPRLSVRRNIASPLEVQGVARAEIEQRVSEAARLLRLEPFLDRLPLELSGGQQQRVALARALVKRADLVLLDEPLANLDYKLREDLRMELPRLFADQGSVLVYATSDPVEALLLGGTTVVLREGRVTQAGPAAEVHRRPMNLETALTCSDPPLNLAPTDADAGAEVHAFRPHHLRMGKAGPQDLGFAARVEGVEITGSETYVHLDMSGRSWIMLLPGAQAIARGADVEVAVAHRHVMRFGPAGEALGLLSRGAA